MAESEDERAEELNTIAAIYPELTVDPEDPFSATLELPVAPTKPLPVRFLPASLAHGDSDATAAPRGAAHVERDVGLSHLPPLTLHLSLPKNYPAEGPPRVRLTPQLEWLPSEKVAELETEATNLWEAYGRCQILFSYIDFVQQAAEQGFGLGQSAEGCLVLPSTKERDLVAFDTKTRQATFDAGTYDCGVCLEPKKGCACYQMKRCGHVFCRQCLQDFYNNAIKEGDVAGVRCLDPGCGAEKTDADGQKRKRKKERTVHPRELLAMGMEESVVRRYVEMKRKKKLEADKSTVYCPRTWCQGPAKSAKYPPIPADLTSYLDNEVASDDSVADDNAQMSGEVRKDNAKNVPPDPSDRLAICEKCSLAFCQVCYMGWHGPFARCYPRDPNELSAEEKASYEYIRKNTSPCPYCNAPVQKTMGCNHMSCFQCRTHFCYLCSSWLDGNNPYQHFNKPGTQCYQRLWELEEGDEGQGPEDGRGFAGGRGWEEMAIEVARQADEAEAEEAAARAQADEDERAHVLPAAPEPPRNGIPLVVALAQIQFDDEDDDTDDDGPRPQPPPAQQRGGRQQRNPFPAHPPGRGAAQAVRNHERRQGRRHGRAVRVGDGRHDLDGREQEELQRFLELARRDQEDGWDSDELAEDDERFAIPHR